MPISAKYSRYILVPIVQSVKTFLQDAINHYFPCKMQSKQFLQKKKMHEKQSPGRSVK